MQIRRNTKAFKSVLEIVSACRERPDREKLVRLFITKAGHSIKDRISVEGIQGGADLFYEMGYQAVLNNLKSANHQLLQSDEVPGIYYFHSTSNKTWDETPFEFDDAIKKEFESLPELPATRKKEKAGKVAFPATSAGKGSTSLKQTKAPPKKTSKIVEKRPKQPNFKLRHEIDFTGLDKVVFRQSKITKEDVLKYYDKIAEYLLPYLKDRPLVALRSSGDLQGKELRVADDLTENGREATPKWIQTTSVGEDKEELLLGADREHLLFYVERGGVAFAAANSRRKTIDVPDYIIIGLDADTDFAKTIDAALAAREILEGLKLPSFVKSGGSSALHIYIPLDTKGDFDVARKAAEYICRLVRVKVPDLVALTGMEDNAYRRVSLDCQLNTKGMRVIAPYSMAKDQPHVAAPLLWEEINKDLRLEDFNYKTIFIRLSETGDPFKSFFRRKVNADALLERLEENYSFLF